MVVSVLVIAIILVMASHAILAQVGNACEQGTKLYNELDCTSYFYCSIQVDGSSRWVETPCRKGTIFPKTGTKCVLGEKKECDNRPDAFECDAVAGTTRGFVDPYDCNKFWWCWLKPEGRVAVKERCSFNASFSQNSETCVWGECPQ